MNAIWPKKHSTTFQRLMDSVVRGLEGVYVHPDDVLVASSDPDEHAHHLCTLFTHLQQNGLIVRLEKCLFGQPVLTFLGHLVNS